jgi:hypothetical protein
MQLFNAIHKSTLTVLLVSMKWTWFGLYDIKNLYSSIKNLDYGLLDYDTTVILSLVTNILEESALGYTQLWR